MASQSPHGNEGSVVYGSWSVRCLLPKGVGQRTKCLGRVRVSLCIAWLCVPLGLPAAFAEQDVSPGASPEAPTVEVVQDRLKRVEQEENLDEQTKVKVREILQQALKDLEDAKQWAASAKRFEQMAATASEELHQTRAALAAPPREPEVSIPEAGLARLEQALSQKAGALDAQRAVLAKLEAEPKQRAARRVEVPKLVAGIREQLDEVDKQLQATTAAADSSELNTARRWSLLARRRVLEAERRSHEKEIKAYEVRVELLPLRRDLAARRIALAEKELSQWRQAVNRQRRLEADTQLKRARLAAAEAHPAIADLTRRNAQLAERRKALSQLIAQTAGQLEDAKRELSALEDRFKRTRDKVDAVGRTDTIGLLLRKEREAMPDVRSHRENTKKRKAAIRQCQLKLLELEDRRSELSDLEAQIRRQLIPVGPRSNDADQEELELAARRTLETEKEYLDALRVDLNSYFDRLIDLDTAESRLVQETDRYVKYIDARVLWIRSTSAFSLTSLSHLSEAAAWLTSPEEWLHLGRSLWRDVRERPLPTAVALFIFGPLVWNQRRLRRRSSEIGSVAGRPNCCSLLPTVKAVFLLALLSLVLPGVLWYVSWRLNVGGNASGLAEAVATGLAYVAGVYLVLDLLQQMCRPAGLADAHFDWPTSALKSVRHYARAAKLLILPFVFVTVTTAVQANDRWADSLGRLSFVVMMLCCALLIGRSFRYTGGIYQAILLSQHDGWLNRLRFLWYPIAVLVPLALAVLAAIGYYYTVQQLALRIVTSAYVLLALILLRNLLLRWILLNRRKLAIEQARQRRAAAAADGPVAEEPAGVSEISVPTDPALDLATINVQTRAFIKYFLAVAGFLGIWLVWVDVLPALHILDQIPLWLAPGQTEVTSLADLCLAVLTFATAVIAARNAPALLELALLHRFTLDATFRYTVGALSRYAILVVGLIAGCNVLGLSWSTVQWLVAAVSVGLGFGLQEIFANFVSGIIILFERPVRIGDVVTVDDITGVVSRIRIRATTITNWERKEFIVPNKEFITGRLLNWTLSDQVNRIVLNVGIAYGSDTKLATELLAKVVREHPLVIEDPPPRVTFEAFGDSSLNYVVRCFLAEMANRLQVIHDLHMAVDHEFRQSGIEIAFPQQDIHVRSIHADLGLGTRVAATVSKTPNLASEQEEDGGAESRHVA